MTELPAVRMHVEGMDCSACAIKIENALKRLPGVSDINVNYTTETLVLNLDEDRTSRKTIADRIRALGYTPAETTADLQEAAGPGQLDRAWWKTRKGHVVIVSAGLLATAFII